MEFDVNIKGFDPDGKEIQAPYSRARCQTRGGAQGHTLNIKMFVPTEKVGEYWFDVYVDDVLKTRVPLRIMHGKPSTTPQPTQSTGTEKAASE